MCNRRPRDKYCTREGGSFVCRHGYNGVCSSLPVEGVSVKDYIIAHAAKHAANMQQLLQFKKSNGQAVNVNANSSLPSTTWSVYSAARNLPAVLNDPNKGKQSNFLTKTWGDSFIEKADVPKCTFIPDITVHHLESYLKKIGRVSLI